MSYTMQLLLWNWFLFVPFAALLMLLLYLAETALSISIGSGMTT